jgi:NDP-sugar pyrophosphorylase family protein
MSGKIQAIVLAGGRGTRLAPLTDNLPKPLVEVRGEPIVLYVLEHLKKHGITNVALAVAHMGDMIQERFGDGSAMGMQISYLVEPEPMGTGGWTQLVDWEKLDDRFLVLNADNLFWIDLEAFLARHDEEGALVTIAAIEIPVDKAGAYEVLQHNDEKRKLLDYVKRDDAGPIIEANDSIHVSSGWYIMTPRVKELIPKQNPISNEFDIWPLLAKTDAVKGFYEANEPWFDSGTHERLAIIEKFLEDFPEHRL